MSYMFQNCYSLQTLDVSGFNTSSVTNMSNMFQNCYSLQTLKAGWTYSSTSNTFVPNLVNLVDYWPIVMSVNQSYNGALMLTRASLLRIIDSLPVSSGKTLTLGQTNENKLTAAEIAVATQKGWTVA